MANQMMQEPLVTLSDKMGYQAHLAGVQHKLKNSVSLVKQFS